MFNLMHLQWMVLLSFFCGNTELQASEEASLENDRLAVTISLADGSIRAIENRLTAEIHEVTAKPFVLLTDHGEFTNANMRLAVHQREGHELHFTYEHPQVGVRLRYRLLPDRHFLEKYLAIENRSPEAILLAEVSTDQLRFSPRFLESYTHDDGTDWKCPICVFLRTEKGGLFTGVENPYFEMITPGSITATRVELRYRPRWRLNPGETFESEPSFLGVYRKENIYFFKEMQAFNYMAGRQIILDWGEVWAMQDFLRDIMPPYKLPFPGYYLRANAVGHFSNLGTMTPPDATPFGQTREYWVKQSHATFAAAMVPAAKQFIDLIAEQGNIKSIDWGTIWLGHVGWLMESPEEYLERLGTDWPIEPNPYWQQVVEHAWEKGLGVGIMDEGGARDYLKYDDRWKIKDRAGRPCVGVKQPYVDGAGRMGRNCWANREFAAWWVKIVGNTIERYRVPIWGTDAGVIWWVPFDPPLECYDTNHGHPTGECGYYAWRNIMWASGELRRTHPQCALRNAGGLHRGYPWVLRDWIEYHEYLDLIPQGEGGTIADNLRFQRWHARNLRFIPTYKHAGFLGADSPTEMAYTAFSGLVGSDHGTASLAWPLNVTDPTERQQRLAFFRKWAQWADEHVEFLRVKRDILGEPRTNKLDGSAHCLGDRGFLFLFNASRGPRAAAIPLNHWIGLTHGDNYTVWEIYPGTRTPRGRFTRGQELLVSVAARDTVVLEIGPSSPGEPLGAPYKTEGLSVDKTFLEAQDVRTRLGDGVAIPGVKDPS